MVAYSFQRRFVAPIQVGLGHIEHLPGTDYVPKRQTIRAVGLRRHARPGEELQLYCAMRSPSCFLIGRAGCSDVRPIEIKIRDDANMQIRMDRKWLRDGEAESFARSDGFGSLEDMWLFWRQEHKGVDRFAGFVILWEGP
jgi:hypothetical protein